MDEPCQLRLLRATLPIPPHPVGNELAFLCSHHFPSSSHGPATEGGDAEGACCLCGVPTQRLGDANAAKGVNVEIRTSRLALRALDPNMDDIEWLHVVSTGGCIESATGSAFLFSPGSIVPIRWRACRGNRNKHGLRWRVAAPRDDHDRAIRVAIFERIRILAVSRPLSFLHVSPLTFLHRFSLFRQNEITRTKYEHLNALVLGAQGKT
jgi:hypothetical protein